MAAVYSKFLGGFVDPPNGISFVGTPPLGTKWIIKDVSVFNDTPPGGSLGGFILMDNSDRVIFARVAPWVAIGGFYEWHGSQVLEYLDQLQFNSIDALAWTLRVSGYQLTTP